MSIRRKRILLSYLRRLASLEFPKRRWSDSPFYIARSWRRQPASLLSAYCHRSDPADAAYLEHDKMNFKDAVHWQKLRVPPIKSLVNGAAAWRIYILHPIQTLDHAKNRDARRNSRKSRDACASEFQYPSQACLM